MEEVCIGEDFIADILLGLGAAKRFPGLDKSAYPKVWNLIASLPKPKHDKVERDAALKTIKGADLSSPSVSVAQDEPLGIAQDTPVVVESAEYATSIFPQRIPKLITTSQHQTRRPPSKRQAHRHHQARNHSRPRLRRTATLPKNRLHCSQSH